MTNVQIPDLAPFLRPTRPVVSFPSAAAAIPDDICWINERITTKILNYPVELRFATSDESDVVLVEQDQLILVNHRERQVTVNLPGLESSLVQQLVLGPALTLLLAKLDLWLIHASAIDHPLGAIVFCGHSGAGKSTLAQALEAEHNDWSRIADDMTIIRYRKNCDAQITPDFPQPRLPLDQQSVENCSPSRIALVCIVSPIDEDRTRLSDVSQVDACLGIVNHMLASTMPIPWLQNAVLNRASTIAEQCPVRVLHYAHTPHSIASASECLEAQIACPP